MLSGKYHRTSDGIWVRNTSEPFLYSDGDEVENRMLIQIRESDDTSVASDELQHHISDWPSEYHFSPLRCNLLSPFQLNRFENILEIGSGCGALTRYLGEKCPKSALLALEGSERRAKITKARCYDLNNVEVCKDSFVDFEPDGLFDCITLIGVLEYSPSFFADSDPIMSMIQHAQGMLSPDGVLIVAIENQLGLKYFNGCTEDHSARPFTGVSDSYKPCTFRTFGKKQLEKKLSRAGFNCLEFFYPFPDYKLTRLLLRDDTFNQEIFDVAHLPGQYPSRDYTGNKERFFNEVETWSLLAKNGLIPDMANSFLVFAGNGRFELSDISEQWLAKSFCGPRKKKYLTETTIVKEGGDLKVKKKLSFQNDTSSVEEVGPIRHTFGNKDYIDGTPYRTGFFKQVLRKNTYCQMVDYLSPWVDFLKQRSSLQTVDNEPAKLMNSGDLFDCLPSNLVRNTNGDLCLFDQEWECCKTLETGFLIFRGIYYELSDHMYLLERTDLFAGDTDTAFGILTKLFNEFEILLDDKIFQKYITFEVDIQKSYIVSRSSRKELRDYLVRFFKQPRLLKTSIYRFLCAGGTDNYDQLQIENDHNRKQLAKSLEELSQMKSCWSMKLGRLLTFIPRALRR